MDDDGRQTEVRFTAPVEDVAVIDAIAFAAGTDRTAVMRSILKKEVERELHRASLICRVARINPLTTDADRQPSGKGPK